MPQADGPVYNSSVRKSALGIRSRGLLVDEGSTPKELYRGDKSGLKAVGFRSFEAKSQGDKQARV